MMHDATSRAARKSAGRVRLAGWLSAILALAPAAARGEVLAWEGTLEILNVAGLPMSLTGTGVATVNESGGGVALRTLRLDGGAWGSSAVPVTDPEVTVSGVVAFAARPELGAGVLAGFDRFVLPWEPKLTRGELPLRGVQGVCLFDPECLPGGFAPMPLSQPPAAMGVGGLLTAGGFAGAIRVSLLAHPWTVQPLQTSTPVPTPDGGTTSVPFTLLPHGWPNPVLGPAGHTGSTAVVGGTVAMVTYTSVTPDLSGAAWRTGARMKLRFVPEPGVALRLACGVGGLLLIGRHRSRRHRSRKERDDAKRPVRDPALRGPGEPCV